MQSAQRLDIKKPPEIKKNPDAKAGKDNPTNSNSQEGLGEMAAKDAARLGPEAVLRPHSGFGLAPHKP